MISVLISLVAQTVTDSLLNRVGVTLSNFLPVPFFGNLFTNSIFWDII